MNTAKQIAAAVTMLALAGLTACSDITGRGPAPLERTVDANLEQQHERCGHVYCMRGWLGIFSTGMDAFAVKVDKEVPAVSVADEEWHRLRDFIIAEKHAGRINEPLVLVGHSWGADDQIRVAEALGEAGIPVDLVVTIDPVTPPVMPSNVKRAFNVYMSHPATDWFPFWRGVEVDPAATTVPVTNIDLRTAKLSFEPGYVHHVNVEKLDGVHALCIEEIRKACPLRAGEGTKTAGVPDHRGPKVGTP
jgi:hypothetical protein